MQSLFRASRLSMQPMKQSAIKCNPAVRLMHTSNHQSLAAATVRRSCSTIPTTTILAPTFLSVRTFASLTPVNRIRKFGPIDVEPTSSPSTSASSSYSSSNSNNYSHSSSSNAETNGWAYFFQSVRAAFNMPLSVALRTLFVMCSAGGLSYLMLTSPSQLELLREFFPEQAAELEEQILQPFRQKIQGVKEGATLLLDPIPVRNPFSSVPTPIVAIIATNIVVFAFHKFGNHNEKIGRFMYRHFYTSYYGVMQGRNFHTVLTSVFSHESPMHLFFNCYVLSSIAPIVVHLMGEMHFTLFYIAAGIFSSVFQLIASHFFTKPQYRMHAKQIPALGASGSLFGLFGIIWAMFPERQYSIIFIPIGFRADNLIPAAGLFDLGGIIYKYIYGPMQGFQLGHAAHFGGLMFGYAYANTILPRTNDLARRRLIYNQMIKKANAARS